MVTKQRHRNVLNTNRDIVCYTAVFIVVTQRSSPLMAAENQTTFLSRDNLANYNSAPIFWKVFAPPLRYCESSNHSFAFIVAPCVIDRIIKIVA